MDTSRNGAYIVAASQDSDDVFVLKIPAVGCFYKTETSSRTQLEGFLSGGRERIAEYGADKKTMSI